MPIYEYRREDGTTFEVMQSITEDALTVCPTTGQKVTKVLHSPAIHFKGSGFHNTDYGTRKTNKAKAAAEAAKKESGSSTEPSSSSSGSSDSTSGTGSTAKSASKSD